MTKRFHQLLIATYVDRQWPVLRSLRFLRKSRSHKLLAASQLLAFPMCFNLLFERIRFVFIFTLVQNSPTVRLVVFVKTKELVKVRWDFLLNDYQSNQLVSSSSTLRVPQRKRSNVVAYWFACSSFWGQVKCDPSKLTVYQKQIFPPQKVRRKVVRKNH